MQGLPKMNRIVLLTMTFICLISIKTVAETPRFCASCNTTYSSNRYTQFEDNLTPVSSKVTLTEDYKKFAESDQLIVYVKEKDLSLRILNKDTNYLWGSSIITENEKLNEIWRNYVNSAITIYYYPTKKSESTKQESITTSPNTTINIAYGDNSLVATVNFGVSKITLKLGIKLVNDTLKIELLNKDIIETNTFLANLRIYPFLGAIKGYTTPGYIFVPDGVGALMRFDQPKNKSAYHKRIYNQDLAFIESSVQTTGTTINQNKVAETGYTRNDEAIYFPVFGLAHGINQNAFVASIDSGSGYGSIGVLPSGVLTEFHQVYPEFHYRYRYIQPTSRSSSITLLQTNRNDFDIRMNYFFLENENANYVGMAKRYQKHLINSQALIKLTHMRNNIPMRLEFLGIERGQGLFFDQKIEMTSIKDIKEIITDLNSQKIEDLTVVYQGWSKGGLSGTAPNYFPLDRKNGSVNALLNIIQQLRTGNSDFLLFSDYTKAYEQARGYSRTNDLAKKVNTLLISGTDFYYNYNLLNPKATQRILTEDYNRYQDYQVSLALADLGNQLFTDYSKQVLSREANKLIYNQLINQYPGKIALYRANEYMLKGLDYYFDTPVYSSQFVKFDDTVPFIPLVLNGYIENYGSYGNFFADTIDELLRLIDYGIYPSFLITKNPSHALINTPSERIYTSQYEDWRNEVSRQYYYVNDALRHVYGKEMISRVVLATGVVQVTYENGVSIIVNYTDTSYLNQGLIIEGNNYKVIGD